MNKNCEQGEQDLFNREALEESRQVLKHRFSQIVVGYLDDCEAYIESIAKGLSTDNVNMIARNAHPLKASSEALGVVQLGKIARILEHTAREAQQENKAIIHNGEQMLTALRTSFTKIKPLMMSMIQQKD